MYLIVEEENRLSEHVYFIETGTVDSTEVDTEDQFMTVLHKGSNYLLLLIIYMFVQPSCELKHLLASGQENLTINTPLTHSKCADRSSSFGTSELDLIIMG